MKQPSCPQLSSSQVVRPVLFSGLLYLIIGLVSSIHGGFDDIYTKVTEDDGKPPKVRFDYRLSPDEKVSKVTVTADDVELVAKKIAYADDPANKTAILFLVDTSDARRTKEMALAKKFLTKVMAETNKDRHILGVYPFHGEIDREFAPLGSSLKDVKASVAKLKATGKNTFIYGSTLKALDELKKTDATRKAIVIISDWKSEDEHPSTEEFVKQVSGRLKDEKVLCYNLILHEVEGSRIDVADTLASVSGGYLVNVSKGVSNVPSSFTTGFLGRIENGGHYITDLAGRESSQRLSFKVETEKGKVYTYEYDRKDKSAKDVTPPDPEDPVAPAEPSTGDDPDPDSEDTDLAADESSSEADDKKKGKLFGIPIWAILAAIGAVVLGLILLLVFLLRSKGDDDEYADEYQSQEFTNEPHLDPMAPADDDLTVPMSPLGGDVPAVESPVDEFDIGNGKAVCRTQPQPGEQVMAVLLFGVDGSRGKYSIAKTATRIGRGSDNDLSFNNDSVSRHHAEILCKRDGTFSVTDLDSGNGVLVNGQEISQQAIREGDVIEIGEVTFTFSTQPY